MAEQIEKLSVEEVRARIEAVLSDLEIAATVEDYSAFQLPVTLADEELRALVVGMIGALSVVKNDYLGGFDEVFPKMVRTIRDSPSAEVAAIIIGAAANTYHHLFVEEEGDEQ